jgi:hypothetical protein
MRCRNCHTSMMDSDLECPSCHASAASAHSAAPGEFRKPSGMVNMLPVFGGAIGGAIAGAMTAPQGRLYSGGAPGPRGSSPIKRIIGVLFLLGGVLFLGIALDQSYNTWKVTQWEPREVTAAELRQAKDAKSSPGPWIAYTFEESKPAELFVTRQRLGRGGDVEARGLLVQVDDKWMFVSVANGFEGNRLVGRLTPLDSAQSKPLTEQIRKIEPNPAAVLPYEFNAVDGSASDQRQRYTGAAVCVFLGLLGFLPGLWLVRGRRRTA